VTSPAEAIPVPDPQHVTGTPATAPRRDETLIHIEGLKTYYPIRAGILRRVMGWVRAVDDVSFEIRRGEVFGLVGESGCGKTTLGRTLLRLEEPTAGAATFGGADLLSLHGDKLKQMRRRMQVNVQDPVGSLNPRMPVSDLIGEGLLAQATKENGWHERKTRDRIVGESLDAVGLRPDYSRRYPHEFSGGQRQRIGIARALALKPEFVFADEPVSALDVSIQSQILNLLIDVRERFNLTYLFVAHNLSVVQYISDRVGVMYLGKMMELADVGELYANPRHPYTVALLSAVPDPDPRIRKRHLVLRGDVPSPAAPPSGCRFHTRCWLREQLGNPENCSTQEPVFRDLGGGHRVACHWAEEVPSSMATLPVGTASEIQAVAPADIAPADIEPGPPAEEPEEPVAVAPAGGAVPGVPVEKPTSESSSNTELP
jgi:oligopeptide/dipeptide ABC transporter ATP-binding protein